MKQAGRQTTRPLEKYTNHDYYAQDVRRVLKRCEAPVEWGDKEAFFLLRLAIEPDFFDDRDCRYTPNVRQQRAQMFAELRAASKGRIFRILCQIRNAVGKRISRK